MIRYWRNPEDMAPGVNLPIDEDYPPAQMFPAPAQAVTAFAAILLVTACGARTDDIVPAPTAALDEDYWRQAPPQPQTQVRPALADTDELPYLGTDEDFWAPPLRAPWPSVRAFADTDELPFTATVTPEEDYWQAPVIQSFGSLSRFPVNSVDEDFVPPPVVVALDEDFWAPPRPAPGPAAQAFLVDPGDVLGFLTVEEQDPPVLARPGATQALRRAWDDEVWVAPAPTVSDEDYWLRVVRAPAPVFRQTWVDEDFRFTPAAPVQDEDFWHNPVCPVVAANYQRLPYLPDPEEIPAGNLIQPTVPKLVLVALGPQNAGTNVLGSSIIGPSQPGVGTGTTTIGPTGGGVGTGSTIIGPTKGS